MVSASWRRAAPWPHTAKLAMAPISTDALSPLPLAGNLHFFFLLLCPNKHYYGMLRFGLDLLSRPQNTSTNHAVLAFYRFNLTALPVLVFNLFKEARAPDICFNSVGIFKRSKFQKENVICDGKRTCSL